LYEPGTDQVKVTDFGIARITDASKTKTGTVMVTPSYMSPEQLAGRKVDGRSDLFSLGVMLYQLASGELPFTGEGMAQLMYSIANEEPEPLRAVNTDVPIPLAVVVERALAKDPDVRYQTGEQMARDLRACLASA
jgi:eukaryotic-like serine/threonine-protein kinase